MEKLKYSDLLKNLEGFDPWLTSLGLTPRTNDRIHEAFKVLRRADETSRKGRETGKYSNIQPADWFPMAEALEAHDVYLAFRADPSPTIAPILKRALSGPIQPIDESPKNRDGRNIWYELALAAEWRLRGASVSLEEPDLRLTRDDITFLVTCKRPATADSIETNLRNAVKQLKQNLDKTPSSTFGVAAISLSCVFNAGDKVFSADVSALQPYLENEIAKCGAYLSSVKDPRVCCVVFHIVTPGLGGEEVDLVRTSFAAAQELTPSHGSRVFEQHAGDMKSAPKQHWEHRTRNILDKSDPT